MNQNLRLLRPVQYWLGQGRITLRWLRYRCSPWLTLAIAPLQLLYSSGVERAHIQIRWFRALVKIDFSGVYRILSDLLW